MGIFQEITGGQVGCRPKHFGESELTFQLQATEGVLRRMNFSAFNSVIITLNEYSFAEVCNSSTTRQIRLPKLRYVNVSKELTFLFKEEN